jgi:hypothetical protein
LTVATESECRFSDKTHYDLYLCVLYIVRSVACQLFLRLSPAGVYGHCNDCGVSCLEGLLGKVMEGWHVIEG